ncbi:unnamed protein product, partial [Allacma fusca]
RNLPSFPIIRVYNMRGTALKVGVICSALTAVVIFFNTIDLVSSCNEAVCASIVSKCTLTQSCKCELRNCSCCKECFDCLSYLYSECCSCVELCPKPNATYQLMMHSQVGDLKEEMPDLFNILTEEKDLQGRWSTFTYPIDIDQSWFQPPKAESLSTSVYTVADGKIIVDPRKEIVTVNCTVAFMSQCMPMNKCKNSCHSMGASYFRWFHDGCCECVGKTCINYGINESRCSACSLEEEDEDDAVDAEPTEESNPVNGDSDDGKDLSE